MSSEVQVLKAQIKAANVHVASLEDDVRLLLQRLSCKASEIASVRVILGEPATALHTSVEQAVLDAVREAYDAAAGLPSGVFAAERARREISEGRQS